MPTRCIRVLALPCLLASLPLASAAQPYVEPPRYHAEDPDAPAVTPENLLESDRFWPYQVELVEDVYLEAPEKPLVAGTRGVLVRIEPTGGARVDFGRHGEHEVPAGRTDVVERANRIRLGEEPKGGPNFVHAIGTKLVDPEPERIRPFDVLRLYEGHTLLAVYAAPEDFERLAEALRPLQGRPDLQTVLFPQGDVPDVAVRERLRALDWTIPFARDELSEGYTASQVAEGAPRPWLVLQTPDGRVIRRGGLEDGTLASLAEAIERTTLARPALAEEAAPAVASGTAQPATRP